MKKKYIKQMTKLKEAALKSEDFNVVHIAKREIEDAEEKVKERLYRTWREHVLYHTWRRVKMVVQYLIAFVWATICYVPFLGLFLVSFVCSSDVDISDGEWNGEDLEASVAAGLCPLMVIVGYPGYCLDMREYLFGREGERRHWIWRKVFRPRDFDEQMMKKLWEFSDKIIEEEEREGEERDMAMSLDELKQEAKGGVKEFAAGVLNRKESRNDKAKKINLGDEPKKGKKKK